MGNFGEYVDDIYQEKISKALVPIVEHK